MIGLAFTACSSLEAETPEPTTVTEQAEEATPEVGTLDNPIPFGETYVVTDLGEDSSEAWEVTVAAPADKTADVVAFHDGETGYEDEYPSDAVHQVVDLTITRLGEVAESPGDELDFSLTVDGIEEGYSAVTFTDGARFRLLDAMQPGATIEYPLVFTVSPGEIGAVALTSPSGTVYFG